MKKSDVKGLRVAVAGAGLMGYWHSRYALQAGVDRLAIFDNNPDAARRLASRLARVEAYTDLEQMFSEVRPDALHICTPLATHFDLAKKAIDAGTHVLVEKPVAPASAEVVQIHRLAEENNLLFCPVHQYCFQHGVSEVKRALANSGPPLRCDFNIASAGAQGKSKSAFNDLVIDILPHPLAVLRHLWPEYPFDCDAWSIRQTREGELLILGGFGGFALSLYITLSARPTRCQFSIQTTDGTFHADLFHGFMVRESGGVSRVRKIMQPLAFSSKTFFSCTRNLIRRSIGREPAYPGLQTLVDLFYGALVEKSAPPISARDSIDVAVARDEIAARMKC